MDADVFYNRAFSRNRGLISEAEQQKLRNARIAIPGMGGMGGVHCAALARTGVGNFTIADFDDFDVHNINRQYGALQSTVGKDKAQVMRDVIHDINPSADVKVMNEAIDADNVDEFLKDVDVVVDALDVFAVQARRTIFDAARKKGIPTFTVAPTGLSAIMAVFSPDGMDLDTYTGIKDGMSETQMAMQFIAAIGGQGTHLKYMDLKRIDPETGGAPSLGLACQLGAGITATEIVCYISGRRAPKYVPWFAQFDPYARSYKHHYRWRGANNPMQRLRMYMLKRMMPKLNSK